MKRTAKIGLSAVLVLVAGACGDGDRTWSVEFDVRVGDAPFRCGTTYDNIGTSGTTISPRDIRFYVHDVGLVGASGDVVPVSLDDDGEWQRDGVGLLDFADDTGDCETGSSAINTSIEALGPDLDDVVGVTFRVGVPPALNHIDSARAPAPLNASGMAWSWTGGFKYARIDVTTSENPAWHIHLGATGCEGDPSAGFDCSFDNLKQIDAMGVGVEAPTVVLDMATVYANSDLDAPIDYQTDFVNGCMAFGGDPECPPIFEALGMTFEGPVDGQQRAFSGE